ncbi:hypothetical protein BVX93_02120 [bacterium B13(2017)]|nr:hypothetical protein BVX93_02120 [bacterium B13(2017)]
MPNKTILVIEDMNSQRFIYKFNFKKMGFNVMGAETGEIALILAETHNPDLIISDVMLPRINGFEVCRQLKANEKTKNIPIIFVTAKSQKEDIIEGINAGGTHYIVKPFDFNELISKIYEIIGKPEETV